jgi:hypothetical protein
MATSKILEWCLPGRKRKGRLRNAWIKEVKIEMEGREITAWNESTGKDGEGR